MLFELVLYRDFSKSHGLRGGGGGVVLRYIGNGEVRRRFLGFEISDLVPFWGWKFFGRVIWVENF